MCTLMSIVAESWVTIWRLPPTGGRDRGLVVLMFWRTAGSPWQGKTVETNVERGKVCRHAVLLGGDYDRPVATILPPFLLSERRCLPSRLVVHVVERHRS
jgi:hypothetical protein